MNHSDLDRNAYMLCGSLAKRGYLRWWHSFSGISRETGERRCFFVEYLILNPVPGKPKKGGHAAPSYVRVSAGILPSAADGGLVLHSHYPISAAKYARKPLYFQVEDNVLRENRITGTVSISPVQAETALCATDAGTIVWDLEIYKTIACHVGFLASPLSSALRALDTFWHAEGIKTHFRGQITVNGELFDVLADDCDGYADKHWGSRFNSPWLQLSSCNLVSERTGKPLKHSALAIDGCCPRFLFFRFRPRLILQLTYTGEDFCYSFGNPLKRVKIKWGTKESRTSFTWHVKAACRESMVKMTLQSPKAEMLPVEYDRPQGSSGDGKGISRVRIGASGYGTLDLYRLTPEGKVWIDTLTIQNALCAFEKPGKTASAR